MHIDVVDNEAAGFLIAAKSRAEGGDFNLVGRLSRVAADNERVQHGEFADHLGDHEIQLIASCDAVDQRKVAIAHGDPVDAVHVAVVEVVTLETPGIDE